MAVALGLGLLLPVFGRAPQGGATVADILDALCSGTAAAPADSPNDRPGPDQPPAPDPKGHASCVLCVTPAVGATALPCVDAAPAWTGELIGPPPRRPGPLRLARAFTPLQPRAPPA